MKVVLKGLKLIFFTKPKITRILYFFPLTHFWPRIILTATVGFTRAGSRPTRVNLGLASYITGLQG